MSAKPVDPIHPPTPIGGMMVAKAPVFNYSAVSPAAVLPASTADSDRSASSPASPSLTAAVHTAAVAAHTGKTAQHVHA